MPKLWKLLAVLLISMFGCNNGFAMQFSQPEEIGFVDERYIMGKAYFRILPFSKFTALYDQ